MGKVVSAKKKGSSGSVSSSSAVVSKTLGQQTCSSPPLCLPTETKLRRALEVMLVHLEEKRISSSSSSSVSDLLSCGVPDWLCLRFRLQYVNTITRSRPLKICLPTPLYNAGQHQVCVIVRDPQRKWKDLFSDHNIKHKVIGFDKVCKRYNTIKLKRDFKDAYDIFFCDKSVAEKMPRTLGTDFIKSKRLPISIDLREDDVEGSLDFALRCAYMYVVKGRNITVRFARTDMTTQQIIQNAQTVCEEVACFFRRDSAWRNNVFAVELFADGSCPLPLFVSPSLIAAQRYFQTGDTTTAPPT
eukprot:GHVS01069816.1.p1 GENE.GHVS01069816.1~~GHVS01069816.1.p1  ORF type:complete len:300 (+),score=43.78 GHVS01069816.1:216-1115(+)